MENTKYKLIHKKTNQETICEKVIVDGYEYYLTPETPSYTEFYFTKIKDSRGERQVIGQRLDLLDTDYSHCKKIIATTNSNIDIPKVVDEDTTVVVMAQQYALDRCQDNMSALTKVKLAVEYGYNKSQETHPFSEDDMREFALFYKEHQGQTVKYWGNDLFKVWMQERIKTLYYE